MNRVHNLDSADGVFIPTNRTAPRLSTQSTLRLGLWRLLLLLSTRSAQGANIGSHLLPLFGRQEFHHLHASAMPQLMNLRFFLIRC